MTNDRPLQFRASLRRKPVIAGLKGPADIEDAVKKGIEIFFFLKGTIFELQQIVDFCRGTGQLVFAHVDLIQGIASDPVGIQFLAQEIGVDGILTTKSRIIGMARQNGLLAIQRLFMLDSEALRTGLSILQTSNPDAVEILPALILPSIKKRLPENLPPIIGGGLVENRQELESILHPPVLAVSTSNGDLWSYPGR